MLQNKMILVIVVAVVGALGGGIFTLAIGLPSSPCAGITPVTRTFTIIASQTGFNDSSQHTGSWPQMTVNKCDLVSITIINRDVQTHGFAIDYYGVKGAELIGQQTYLFPVFQATRAGQFRVYCNVYCTIHNQMQNGLLIVS